MTTPHASTSSTTPVPGTERRAAPGGLARIDGERLLRLALKADAVVSGANGLAYLGAASLLDEPIGVSAGLLRAVGLFLVVYAALVWSAGSRRSIAPVAVRAVIAANVLWAVDSIALVVFGVGSLTTIGSVWAVLQAITVGAFAAVQATALRRAA